MSVRTLWFLILKTIGMWLIINCLISLPAMARGVSDLLANPLSLSAITIEIAYLILIVISYFLIFRLLIMKPDWTINFFKLEKGFEKIRINLTLPYNKLLKIAIILIGGVLFARTIPNLVESLYLLISGDLLFSQDPKNFQLIIYSTQVIIGLLIMTNSNLVQRYINRKDGKAEMILPGKEEF